MTILVNICIFIHSKTKKSGKVKNYIADFMNINEVPIFLQADIGSEFCNKILQVFEEQKKFKIIHSNPRYLQSQGIVERYNGIIKQKINLEYRDKGKKNSFY